MNKDYKKIVKEEIDRHSVNMECTQAIVAHKVLKRKAIKFFREYLNRTYSLYENNDLWLDYDTIKMILKQSKIFIDNFPFQTSECNLMRRELDRLVINIFKTLKEIENEK